MKNDRWHVNSLVQDSTGAQAGADRRRVTAINGSHRKNEIPLSVWAVWKRSGEAAQKSFPVEKNKLFA
jgi:hypothetical protein